jgi:ABC-2 type transport system permease protein
VHIAREPLQLSDVTVQPVLFTLLFVYVFGSGVVLPGGGSYTDFAIAGLLALNLTTSAMGTAVGLSSDLNSGVIDRFRTLPMWRAAVLVGRSLADLLTAALCTLIVAVTGLVIGWAPGLRCLPHFRARRRRPRHGSGPQNETPAAGLNWSLTARLSVGARPETL